MITPNTIKSAVFLKAGNSKQNTHSGLSAPWLSLCRQPNDWRLREQFSAALDMTLKDLMPDGKARGPLSGREDELRQSAHLLLIRRYLTGNENLMASTSMGNNPEVENEILRSCGAALRIASQKMQREILREQNRYEYHRDIDEIPHACCLHPAQVMHRWQLPFEAQRQLLFLTLEKALRERSLPRGSVEMVQTMAEHSVSQAKLARRLNVSRSAIHQRIGPVRTFLRREIDNQEFPLT